MLVLMSAHATRYSCLLFVGGNPVQPWSAWRESHALILWGGVYLAGEEKDAVVC